MKTKKWSTLKEALFLYLAISKISYYIERFSGILDGDTLYLLDRLLSRELPYILVVLCILYIDKMKGNFFRKMVILYPLALMVFVAYYWVLNQIFGGSTSYLLVIRIFTWYFFIIAAVMGIKEYLKEIKEKRGKE